MVSSCFMNIDHVSVVRHFSKHVTHAFYFCTQQWMNVCVCGVGGGGAWHCFHVTVVWCTSAFAEAEFTHTHTHLSHTPQHVLSPVLGWRSSVQQRRSQRSKTQLKRPGTRGTERMRRLTQESADGQTGLNWSCSPSLSLSATSSQLRRRFQQIKSTGCSSTNGVHFILRLLYPGLSQMVFRRNMPAGQTSALTSHAGLESHDWRQLQAHWSSHASTHATLFTCTLT